MSLFYNGVHYEIETEGDIEPINLLAAEEIDENPQVSDSSKEFQESIWTAKVTHLFLDECIKRKMLIRDPKIQKHKLFFAIYKQMKAKGYNFKVITLERKLRTMKKHYMSVHENNKNPSMKRVYWQYYEKLKILYPECLNQCHRKDTQPVSTADKMNSPSTTLHQSCEKPILNQTTCSTDVTNDESSIIRLISKDYSLSSLLGFAFYKKKEYQTTKDNEEFQKSATKRIEIARKQILNLEERRTIATEKILMELRQSNKLKEDILELNIKLFDEKRKLEEY